LSGPENVFIRTGKIAFLLPAMGGEADFFFGKWLPGKNLNSRTDEQGTDEVE
jgi:hypothetical protein